MPRCVGINKMQAILRSGDVDIAGRWMMDLNRIWEHWTERKVVIIVFPRQSIPLLVCFEFRAYKDFGASLCHTRNVTPYSMRSTLQLASGFLYCIVQLSFTSLGDLGFSEPPPRPVN